MCFGNHFSAGFHAWAVYEPHCKHRTASYTNDCFSGNVIPTDVKQSVSIQTDSYANAVLDAGKVYERCELAKELRHRHNVPLQEVANWVCIALYQSNLVTSAKGIREHGLFQISSEYWCSIDGSSSKACNLECSKLEDSDITDDLQCAQKIWQEHQRISGNGYLAWSVYEPYCHGRAEEIISGCFNDVPIRTKPTQRVPTTLLKPVSNLGSSLKATGKVYEKCELAKELRYVHNVPKDQLHTWICIIKRQSSFNTSALGAPYAAGMQSYGLYQINEQYWCSNDLIDKGCGVRCANLIDGDIADDVRCARHIFDEHQRIFGNGFSAWAAYNAYCSNESPKDLCDCFDDCNESTNVVRTNEIKPIEDKRLFTNDVATPPKGKRYDRCELAKELRYKHNIPKEQIHTWICIVQRESNFDTSVVGRLNADGSGDHGLFQISDIYWCSVTGINDKACGVPCSKFEDSDITDDVKCVRKIYDEHTRISGNGKSSFFQS